MLILISLKSTQYCVFNLLFYHVAFHLHVLHRLISDSATMSENDCSESESGSSGSASTVVTDAAHPLFLEPADKSISCTAKPPKYQCPQCNERLINKSAFLKKHFEKTPHKSVSQCPSCNGNVYPYLDHGTTTVFHKCRKKEALQDLNSNYATKYTQRSNPI